MKCASRSSARIAKRIQEQTESLIQFHAPSVVIPPRVFTHAIEDDAFPFEEISHIAEMESWRKEINRPLSHIHKWWAQRLGTVFRAVVLGTLAPKGSDVLNLFYSSVRIPHAIIFDPFMGSGTTVVEALKLGTRAIGRDINQVAYFLVRNALAIHNRESILSTFHDIQRDVAPLLSDLYVAQLSDGRRVPALYYFWVKTIPCPECAKPVDLFSSYVFAQHAYANKFPQAHAVCPSCGGINKIRFDTVEAACTVCKKTFNPKEGNAKNQLARCPSCHHQFPIAKTVRAYGTIPNHRLYAKMVLLPDGRKEYLAADVFDEALLSKAQDLLALRENPYPIVRIEPGYNTNQALGYNYQYWHEFFNPRQLLCLSILSERIREIKEPALRDLFVCLFSGVLEFNNMFTSYKGEGTGAVRHMFYHHILKPERVPLEANLWGTYKSSGSFSTLFQSRIMRALDYAARPFELKLTNGNRKTTEKVYDLSEPIGYKCALTFDDFNKGKRVYLSCGDSGHTDLPPKSVDAIVTDPPFYDNVHYSQLADFFFVWQQHIFGRDNNDTANFTTRSPCEVQNSDPDAFAARLKAVWQECYRVLKDEALFVFTYHHSRAEGWRSVLSALMEAGFGIVAAHPVKAEMAVATPKQQAKEPINLDIIIVCRKIETLHRQRWSNDLWGDVISVAANQIARLYRSGRSLSRNDVRVILMAQLLRQLSVSMSATEALCSLDAKAKDIEMAINSLCQSDSQNQIQRKLSG
jgi:adenine-specific DNA methylase